MDVEITGVELRPPPLDHLWGANVESPREGTLSSHVITVEGWALGRSAAAEVVEVVYDMRIVLEIPIDRERADLAEGFPALKEAVGRSGFRAPISTLSFAADFEIELRLRLRSGTRIVIATVRGRRERLPVASDAQLHPLLVNTIGRSGSTYLTRLLGAHPRIAAFDPLAQDARVATYWATAIQDLAQPHAYLQQIGPDRVETPRWWLGEPGRADDSPNRSDDFTRWLASTYPQTLVAIARAGIEDFYRTVTDAGDARYFVEKALPFQVQADLLAEIYPAAKEVILARDFRDVLCSILAFNAKRGFAAFGAEGKTEAGYLRTTHGPAARRLARRFRERGDRVLLVRYEDLISEPVESAARILRYLDLETDRGVLEGMVAEAQGDPASQQHRTVADPAATIGRWRRDLSPELKSLCEEELGPALTELGYEGAAGGAAGAS